MQQRIALAATPDRHHQGIADELRCHSGAHRSAHHASGEEVDDRGHIEPAFRCPEIGEVSDPFAVGGGGFEGAIQNVRTERLMRLQALKARLKKLLPSVISRSRS
jgi:hypothetical protein